MAKEISNLITQFDDVEKFNEAVSVIVEADTAMAVWYIGDLHYRCAKLLAEKDTVKSAQHTWSGNAFRATPTSPFRRDSSSESILRSPVNGDPLDYWKALPVDAFQYFWESILTNTEPLVRVQYLASLWESKNIWKKLKSKSIFTVPEISKMLIAASVEVVNREMVSKSDLKGAGMQATQYLEIAVFIASKFQEYTELLKIIPNVLTFAETLLKDAPHWSLGLAEVLLFLAAPNGKIRNGSIVTDADLARLQKIVEQVQARYDSEPGHGGPEEVLLILMRIEVLLGKKFTAQEYERRVAEGYLKRAEQPWPSFIKAGHMKDAAAHYQAAGMREEAGKMKLLSRQAIQKAAENNEFKAIRVSQSISHEKMEQALVPYFHETDEAYEVLLRTSQRLFAPSIESGRPFKPQSILAHLMPTVPIVDDRIKATQTNDGGTNAFQEKENWVREIRISSTISLTPIFEKLRNEYDLTYSDLYSVLSASEFLRYQDRPFIQKAVERYLAKDYISCIHVLVPRIEQLIRSILIAVGADVTAYKDGDLRERPLGELLREAEEKDFMPKALVQLFQAVLSEEWGMNLRNRVAHGLIVDGECDVDTAHRVIHIGIILNQLVMKTVEKPLENTSVPTN